MLAATLPVMARITGAPVSGGIEQRNYARGEGVILSGFGGFN
ncbi:hypothetical protein WG908_06555 [Sphingobium sp. AN641]